MRFISPWESNTFFTNRGLGWFDHNHFSEAAIFKLYKSWLTILNNQTALMYCFLPTHRSLNPVHAVPFPTIALNMILPKLMKVWSATYFAFLDIFKIIGGIVWSTLGFIIQYFRFIINFWKYFLDHTNQILSIFKKWKALQMVHHSLIQHPVKQALTIFDITSQMFYTFKETKQNTPDQILLHKLHHW